MRLWEAGSKFSNPSRDYCLVTCLCPGWLPGYLWHLSLNLPSCFLFHCPYLLLSFDTDFSTLCTNLTISLLSFGNNEAFWDKQSLTNLKRPQCFQKRGERGWDYFVQRAGKKIVNPKVNQPWTFIEGLMLKLKLHTLPTWNEEPTHWKNTLMPAEIERAEREGVDKVVGWHHQVKGHEFEQTLGDCEGQGSLACCSPWCRKELTWFIDWTYIYKTKIARAPSMHFRKCLQVSIP